MKKIYGKEEGVSPVIATILMVAITVVLAATVYILVSGYINPSKGNIQGSLMYDMTSSDPTHGWANFTVQMSQPANGIPLSKLVVTVNGQKYSGAQINTTGLPTGTQKVGIIDTNGDGKLNSGDIIAIHLSGDISGQKVIVAATGYDGSMQGTIGS